MAAAVVYEPLGSANTDTTKGGNIDFCASSSMSFAITTSRPPMNRPVFSHALRPAREDGVLRQPSDVFQVDVRIRHYHLIARIDRHVDVERTGLLARREDVEDGWPINTLTLHDASPMPMKLAMNPTLLSLLSLLSLFCSTRHFLRTRTLSRTRYQTRG